MLPLKDKGVRDGGHQRRYCWIVGEGKTMTSAQDVLPSVQSREHGAQSTEHKVLWSVARVSMWVFSDSTGPCSGCRCQGGWYGGGGSGSSTSRHTHLGHPVVGD